MNYLLRVSHEIKPKYEYISWGIPHLRSNPNSIIVSKSIQIPSTPIDHSSHAPNVEYWALIKSLTFVVLESHYLNRNTIEFHVVTLKGIYDNKLG